MEQMKHTPGPWIIVQDAPRTSIEEFLHDWHIKDGTGTLVGWVPRAGRANADFILRACNSHEQLLEACKLAVGCLADSTAAETGYTERVLARLIAAIAAGEKD